MRSGSYLVESGAALAVAPLVDVVLLLLIFFMLVSRYLPPTLSVTLPEAATATMVDRPAVSVSIDVEGRLTVDGRELKWDALPGALSGRDERTQVRIAADRATDYDYVVRVMDTAAAAGLVHIALETSPSPK